MHDFALVVQALTRHDPGGGVPTLVDAPALLVAAGDDDTAVACRLTGAFLDALGAGDDRHAVLDGVDDRWDDVAALYRQGLAAIPGEIARRADEAPEVAAALRVLVDAVGSGVEMPRTEFAEHLWRVLFPEGGGVLRAEKQREGALRRLRTVAVLQPPTQPIADVAGEVLFTANALLTTPLPSRRELDVDERIAEVARTAAAEDQRYFYDHPIPVGIEPEANEILYGLTHLDDAIAFERERGTVPDGVRVPCVLSVSVTHHGLRPIARDHVADVLDRAGGLRHLDVHVFGEDETDRLVAEVLAPAARHLLARDDADLLDVVGVDGRYGRHYSFLKAIAALWHVLVDDRVRATFKIDLDQVFPQDVLVEQTGRSAFEHLAAPLWGARGEGVDGDIELGMLAGSLVNERDIAASLFTPDVGFPDGPGAPADHVFFSKLPQALSTVAEMGTRYAAGDPDGVTMVLERIHVTGGTTGARVDALRRHRPFTPSFIARAEDQAYVLATYGSAPPRLAYLHADGLIMRHDKEAFAGEAIRAAAIGKLIGDHVRILLFSAYGRALGDIDRLKAIVDPFTGCFVSRTPVTTTLLRFALEAAALLDGDAPEQGVAFVRDGASRLREALAFVEGDPSPLTEALDRERRGWALFYDVLDALEAGLARGEQQATDLAAAARRVMADARIG